MKPARPREERIRPQMQAVLALGSNLGDRERNIRDAVVDIDALDGVQVEAVSHLVESAALKLTGVDYEAPAYLNAVIMIRCAMDPHTLLDAANAIEAAHGRVRDERWGDRTLDIDIITFAGLQRSDDRLTLPHPLAAERSFVLVPWSQIDPNAVLPGHGPVSALLETVNDWVKPYRPDDDRTASARGENS